MRFTKAEKTVTRHHDAADRLNKEPQGSPEDLELATRSCINAMAHLNTVYHDLQEVQDQLDFDQDNGKRLEDMDEDSRTKEDENEEKFRETYLSLTTKVQVMEETGLNQHKPKVVVAQMRAKYPGAVYLNTSSPTV